jgi:hypothetical protein
MEERRGTGLTREAMAADGGVCVPACRRVKPPSNPLTCAVSARQLNLHLPQLEAGGVGGRGLAQNERLRGRGARSGVGTERLLLGLGWPCGGVRPCQRVRVGAAPTHPPRRRAAAKRHKHRAAGRHVRHRACGAARAQRRAHAHADSRSAGQQRRSRAQHRARLPRCLDLARRPAPSTPPAGPLLSPALSATLPSSPVTGDESLARRTSRPPIPPEGSRWRRRGAHAGGIAWSISLAMRSCTRRLAVRRKGTNDGETPRGVPVPQTAQRRTQRPSASERESLRRDGGRQVHRPPACTWRIVCA